MAIKNIFRRNVKKNKSGTKNKKGDNAAAAASLATTDCLSLSTAAAATHHLHHQHADDDHNQHKFEASLSEELQGLDCFEGFDDDDADGATMTPKNNTKYAFRSFVEESLGTAGRRTSHSNGNKWNATSRLLASEDRLVAAMNVDYTEVLLEEHLRRQEQQQSSAGGVGPHLRAALHLLWEFVKDVQPLLEDGAYSAMPDSLCDMVYGAMEGYVRPRIVDFYSEEPLLGRLTPGDAAQIARFVDEYLQILTERCPSVTPSPEWPADLERLVDLYMDRAVRNEMRAMMQRCVDLEANVREDSEGNMVTGRPEEVAFMIDSQLAVARECLPASDRYLPRVLHICNQELLHMVGDLMLDIGANWREYDSRRFCAAVNGGNRIAELCEERNDRYFFSSENDNDLVAEEYRQVGDSVVREFSEFSMHATTFLCNHILSRLREPQPILTSVGTAEWELFYDGNSKNSSSAVERTIATFADYFADLEGWLSGEYFFPKVLKTCFDMTLQEYIDSFFSNTLARGVQDPARVAKQLEDDYLRLAEFFNGKNYERYHGVAGCYDQTTVNARLHVLRCLSQLVDPKVSPEEASDAVRVMLQSFQSGRDDAAEPAILHVVGLRKRHTDHESVEWLREISKTKKMLLHRQRRRYRGQSARKRPEEERSGEIEYEWQQFTLPDLRNSRYLYNVRPRRHEIHRRISAESIAMIDATSRLLMDAPRHMDPRQLFTAR